MKVRLFFPLAGICAGLVFQIGVATAAEPVRTLQDLTALEAKVEAVSNKVMPATVALLSEKTESSGSGVITTADGLILTAAHVVQGTDSITVVFTNGQQVPGKVLGANYSKDIAMVQIEGKGPWPFVEMGNSKPLVAGDWVIAMGHSAGFDASRTPPVRFGHVISKGPGNFLTTDCTLIGGDSGGPLFDINGRIVGVNSSIGTALTNNNHAGVDGFKEDWERIRGGEAWGKLSMNPFANPEMPALGIEMGLPRGVAGVPVEAVTPRSPSAAAGIRVGDVIQKMDGNDINEASALLQVLAKKQPGDKVKLGVLRGRSSMDLEVVLSPRNSLFQEGFQPQVMLSGEDVPLLLPGEKEAVDRQNNEFSRAITPSLTEAAKSTVRIWSGSRRLAYGTVIGDGTEILTKWSEVARATRDLRIDGDEKGGARSVIVQGVYREEDLAVLKIEGEPLVPVKWSTEKAGLGDFLAAVQPDGQPAAFGVVSVLARNLRTTDLAYLGVYAQPGYDGKGVKIKEVDPESGAKAAGLGAGQVILKVGERSISGLLELQNALTGLSPGSKVSLLVEVNGTEKTFEVELKNRPKMRQFSGDRLQVMERMGGPISRVRDSFSQVLQTDMRPVPNQIGGPVVDLQGKVVGITMARADRTRSFVMPSSAVMELLKKPLIDAVTADVQDGEEQAPLPTLGQVPRGGGGARRIPGGPERMQRHLGDMRRLAEYMQQELDELEGR